MNQMFAKMAGVYTAIMVLQTLVFAALGLGIAGIVSPVISGLLTVAALAVNFVVYFFTIRKTYSEGFKIGQEIAQSPEVKEVVDKVTDYLNKIKRIDVIVKDEEV